MIASRGQREAFVGKIWLQFYHNHSEVYTPSFNSYKMNRNDEIYARMILDILRTNLRKLFAWNFQYPKVIKNGVRAYVAGFIYEGYIEITYNPFVDLYCVVTFKEDGSVSEKEEYIHLERLIEVVDIFVQGSDNNMERVIEWYAGNTHYYED